MHPRIHFLHWGNHHGTNAFAHVQNVILAGTFFLPDIAYEGLARVSSGAAADDKVEPETMKEVERGETAHAMLQGICRAAVRQIQGNSCGQCTAYVIASPKSGVRQMLPEVFPGCKVSDWKPRVKDLKGNVKRAVEHVQKAFGDDQRDFYPFRELQLHIGISDASNFRRSVRNHPDFKASLRDAGLEVGNDANGKPGIQRGASVFTKDDD